MATLFGLFILFGVPAIIVAVGAFIVDRCDHSGR